MMLRRLALLAVVSFVAQTASAFYLPGIKPVSYDKGEQVEVDVNGLHSNTALLPFEYYQLPFCRPQTVTRKHETLGEVLMGDRIETSQYRFKMAVDSKCELLDCQPDEIAMDKDKLAKIEKFIESNYRAYMVLDNLPVFNNGSLVYQGQCKSLPKSEQYEYLRGYALGVTKRCTGDKTLINNHLHFRIQYHRHSETEYRVVGFTATPYSVLHSDDGSSCNEKFDPVTAQARPLTTNPETKKIRWSYGVTWVEEPDIEWASRWDSYLHTSFADVNSRVHWFSIVNSMLIVFCLMCVTLVALIRSLRRDFARYNEILAQLESKETAQEESGWKTIHDWVVVPPSNINWLIVAVSTGFQVVGMSVCTLFFACLGFLSPANRGALVGAVVLLYVIQSFVAGYICARMLKRFSERSWVPVFHTGMLVPGMLFGLFVTLNMLSWSQKTSTAVPLLTVVALLTLWLGISLPLTILGAAFGFSAEPTREDKFKTRDPRPIPVQEWYLTDAAVMLLAPTVAFGATFMELRFILASLWQGMVYYVFGFLSIVFVLWACCCALITIVVIYYRLCAENYNWWWLSFFASNGAGAHLLLYSVVYFFTQLSITSKTGAVMYFSYMLMVTAAYVLASGAIGFVSTYAFQRRIYAAVKRD